MRSAYIDTELMLVINSKDINKQLKASMEEYEKKAATVKNETEYSHIPEGMKMKELSDKKKNIKSCLSRKSWNPCTYYYNICILAIAIISTSDNY